MTVPNSVAHQVERLTPLRPIVAIVGRPNVGKSTLFNRLLGRQKQSITDDRPGVTRDRLYAEAEWDGQLFTLVDTGGYIPRSRDGLEIAVRMQAEKAVEEADLIMLVCEIQIGVTDVDREVARLLHQSGKPALLVVNKVDKPGDLPELHDFLALGLGQPVPVSAVTGQRSGDLLDALLQQMGSFQLAGEEEEDPAIKVALVGRPNVGKSTLINRLAGQLVSIVHDQPGTTRDTTNIRLSWNGREFTLMDTAGMRRRSQVTDPVEYYSALRASTTLDKADVVVLLIDAEEGCSVQDARIANRAIEKGRAVIIAVNKWDLQEGTVADFSADLHHRFPFLRDFPLLTLSGLTGRRVHKCLDMVLEVHERWSKRVSTGQLNRFISRIRAEEPPTYKGREVRMLYATQLHGSPPSFVIFATRPEAITADYKRFLDKRLREEYNLVGTPVRIFWRRRRAE